MKVLFWLKQFPATSETFIRDQIIHLIDEGVSVQIFAKKITLDSTALEGFETYQLKHKVNQLVDFWPRSKWKRLLHFLILLPKVVFSKHAAVYRQSLRMSKYGKSAANLIHFFTVHYLLQQRTDIIHAHYGTLANELLVYKEMGVPFKLFVTFHGFDVRLGKENKSIYASLCQHADKVLSISSFNRTALLDFGFQNHQIIDIPNGIDTQLFVPTYNKDSRNGVQIISVGRLSEIKGFSIALEALARYKNTPSAIKFQYTIVGEGSLKNNLEQQIKVLGLQEEVVLQGKLSSNAIAPLLSRSDVFFLPSLEEALPTVVLEAMACELPILATRVGAVEEMIKDAGICVTPNNVSAFQKGWEQLVAARSQWDTLGKTGRDKIKKDYDVKIISKKLVTAYKESIQ